MSFDNDITLADRLLNAGIQDVGRAQKNLELLRSRMGSEEFRVFLPGLLSNLARSADPDLALNNFERLAGGFENLRLLLTLYRENQEILGYLIAIFGASRFLSTFVIAAPAESLSLLSDPSFLAYRNGQEALAERLNVMIGSTADDQSFFRLLRIFRKQEMLRICLRDLIRKADFQGTVSDLSDLAEVCLEKAYEWADSGLRARYGQPMAERVDGGREPASFAIIAMGKLGGRELNFSSDVDLMYVYSADGETQGITPSGGPATNKITNHQYFVKLAEKVTAAIGQKTEDGFVFRVDLRLRPEGQRGPLAQSLGGYEIYYESWGQTWERSALIKARPAAGDEGLGRDFIERITPFVYRKYLDYGAIAEIRDMKQKINKDVEQKGRTHRDVKLGYGGIREIEFVIQALQLIYGGRDRSIRQRNSLKALHLLSQKGLITYDEYSVLATAYVFLRTIEHRIQMLDDLQTQTIPLDEREVRTLARGSGYLEQQREVLLLAGDYATQTRAVRRIFDALFAFTGEDRGADSAGRDYDLLLDRETPEQETIALFKRYGFQDPAKACRNLVLLRDGAAFVLQTPRSRKLFNDVFPSLFELIVSSPDPDTALNNLESFLAAQGSWESFQPLLNLDASAGRVLVAIFANSDYFSRMLISSPVLLQNLLESRNIFGLGSYWVFVRGLSAALENASGITEKLDALRRFKHQEEMRIGMADLLSELKPMAASRDLSKLAEVCLEAAMKLAVSEINRKFDSAASGTGLAIIGAGKLGGRELTYGSDLDVLFVYSESYAGNPPAGISLFEYFSKIAEKTISYLSTLTREGFAFRIDTRLRPTGSKGPLVQTIEAIKSYYADQAWTWERQALLRTRYVAGDRTAGSAFCREIQKVIYRDPDTATLAGEVRTMRKRIEDEAGKEDSMSYNIKQGAGGLVDIEFIVQYLQLLHGNRRRSIRVPGTFNALLAIRKQSIIKRVDCDFLAGAYLFLRRLESRMRIASNQATSELMKEAPKLQQLARRMGYRDAERAAGQQLLDYYKALSTRVRELFQEIVTPS